MEETLIDFPKRLLILLKKPPTTLMVLISSLPQLSQLNLPSVHGVSDNSTCTLPNVLIIVKFVPDLEEEIVPFVFLLTLWKMVLVLIREIGSYRIKI